MLDDGVAGLSAIARHGGVVIVQDPADALFSGMPTHALRVVTPDYVVPAAEIGSVLSKIVTTTVDHTTSVDELVRWENDVTCHGARENAEDVGVPSGFSCPDCGGVLADLEHGQRFRCRVGHAWTADALLAAQDSELEKALWTALRSLEEKATLARRMAATARDCGSDRLAVTYDRQVEETVTATDVIRRQLGVSG